MKTEISSVGIRKFAGNLEIELVGSTGHGDSKLSLWRRDDGQEAIETNGDPVFAGENGFDEARTQIVG